MIFFYSLLLLFTVFCPLRVNYAIVRSYLRIVIYILKVVCRIDYQVEGREHIPPQQSVIIFCKHQSTWETFFLPLIFNQPAIILKRELLWIPFFGWGLASLKPIAIDRNNKTSAMQQIIKQGQAYLAAGRPIVIFPEGTRIAPGKMGHFHAGGARLAAATAYPILPIAHNAGYCWPRRSFLKRPGIIRVVIGPLIQSKDKKPEEILALSRSWMESTMRSIEGFVDKSSSE